MGRKERIAEEQARRAKIRELLELSQVSSIEDIRNLFKETIAEFMENGLDAELSEGLGYSKYDYRNIEEKILSMYAKGMTTGDIAIGIDLDGRKDVLGIVGKTNRVCLRKREC